MWETASLLLAVVGGYAFSKVFKLTQLSALKEDGYALFFQSVFWGYAFFHAACLMALIYRIDQELDWGDMAVYWLNPIDNRFWEGAMLALSDSITHYKSDFTVPSLAALWLGLFAGWPLNYLLASPQRQLKLAWADLTDIEIVLQRSMTQAQLLLVTLDSNKVYAGWVIRTPRADLKNEDPGTAFEMLTLMSGYRDPLSQTVTFTTFYQEVLEAAGTDNPDVAEQVSVDSLSTFIPLHRVVSLKNFSEYYYPLFKEKADQQPKDGNAHQSDGERKD